MQDHKDYSRNFSRIIALLPGMHDPREILGKILDNSMDELCYKFQYYGNSYLVGPASIAKTYDEGVNFWRKRLSNEVLEYGLCLTAAERKRKLANLFNLVWMAYGWELQAEGVSV